MVQPGPAEEIRAGMELGRYRLLKELGRGSMGMVFLAEDARLGERMCVKLLHPALMRNQEAVERFSREILLARRIVHPGICRVFDLHEEQGLRLITMEHVEGSCLRDMLGADQPLMPVPRAAKLLSGICDALVAAHDAGVIHRDLKPRNIMVRPDGTPVILDFGIATALDIGSNLTMPGVALGTKHYIAPEVWAGRSASPRSDQFALGVMLFNCLTGKMPFRATNEMALLQEMRKGPAPPPSVARAEVGPALDAIALRALAFSPDDRFPDVRAMGRALEAALASPGAPQHPVEKMALAPPSEPDAADAFEGAKTNVISVDEADPVRTQPSSPPLTLPSFPPDANSGSQRDVTVVVPAAEHTQATHEPTLDMTRPGELPMDGPVTHSMGDDASVTDDAALVGVGASAWRRKAAAAAVAVVLLGAVGLWLALRDRAAPVSEAQRDAGPSLQDQLVLPPVPPPFPSPSPPSAPTPPLPTPQAPPAPDPTLAVPPPPPPEDPIVPVEPVPDAPEPAAVRKSASVSPPRAPRRADDGERAAYASARAELDAALRAKGLLPGDDAELDRARGRMTQLAAQKKFGDATAAARDAQRRVADIEVDKAFVRAKLVRFNARFDDSKSGAARSRADSTVQAVMGALAGGRFAEANRALNDGFAALGR